MSDGHFPTLVSKDRDANVAANPIYVQLSDGTAVLTSTGGSLDVNITGGASSGTEFAEDSAHSSGALGGLALVVRKDTIASNVSADGDYATLLQDANGRLYVQIHDGGNSITVDATDLDIRDLTATDIVTVVQATHDNLNLNANIQVGNTDVANGNPVPVSDAGGSLTVDATDLDIRNLSSAQDSVAVTDGGGSITVDGSVTVSSTDLDIRDLTLSADAVKVSGNSTANGPTNPIYVQMVDVGVLSNEVHSYNTAADVASDTASNHDYTVSGTTFLLKQVTVASSGGCKIEVRTGPVGSLATRRVGFIPKEGGYCEMTFTPPVEVPATSTGTIRVVRTNRQGQAQDLYSSIDGNDVA